MFALILFCSTVIVNTEYISQAGSFDDMVDMVPVDEETATSAESDVAVEDSGDEVSLDQSDELTSDQTTEGTVDASDEVSEDSDTEEIEADLSGDEDVDLSDTEVTFTQTIDNVVVTATADAGVIPEDATLVVNSIEEGSDQYTETETKLNEQAENDGYEIAGFLAYDIYFQDADGNKIEPEDGTVKVSFNYTEASIPEEIKETVANGNEVSTVSDEDLSQESTANQTAVAMMHLVEDESGNIKSVVDMTKEGTATVETNEDGEVQKAEFETSSFSTFTITWYVNQLWRNQLNVKLVDENGNEIGQNLSTNVNAGTSSITVKDKAPSVSGYSFSKAKIASNASDKGTELSYLRFAQTYYSYYTYYAWQYSADNSTWNNINNQTVYFVYSKDEDLSTISTVDHNSKGITMTLKDLVTGGGGDNYWSIGADTSNLINFGEAGTYTYNKESGGIKQGLLNEVLKDGYPTLSSICQNSGGSSAGTSISSLFSGGITVNHLFSEDIYNRTGYYEYSSFNNYAYLQERGDFKVYDAIGSPLADNTTYYYLRGNFLPYNDITASDYKIPTTLYKEDGESYSNTNYRKLYQAQKKTTIDYQFGMEMQSNFLQPKNGKATWKGSSSDMIFEFNGDDDMWIYIDNVLVLDIGGVHDAHSGSINFNTGVVSWYDCTTGNTPTLHTTNIKAQFKAAGVFPDGTIWDDSKVDNYFSGNTFIDYSTHSFKMFYMERGAGASNLHIKFNLQTIPEGQVEVKKEIDNTDKEKYSDAKFAFQLYAQKIKGTDKQGNEKYSDSEYVLVSSSAYYGENGTATSNPITFGNATFNGESYKNVFYLAPGESAIFTGIKSNRKYYVKEIGVNSSAYNVIINNVVSHKETDDEGNTSGKIKNYKTDEKYVSSRPVVVFKNSCTDANSRELRITKKIDPDQTTTDTFSFKVKLGGNAQSLKDYAGNYYVTDSSGNYYYRDDSGNLRSNGNEAKICGTTTDGKISGIPKDYTITLTQIMAGTYYKVEEINLDGSKYMSPAYKTEDVSGDKTDTTTNESNLGGGVIRLGYHAAVTVTNTPYCKIKVNKVWKKGTETVTDKVYVGLYKQETDSNGTTKLTPVSGESGYKILTSDNSYTDVFEKLDSRYNYVVRELRQAAKGETSEFTIDIDGVETGFVKVDQGYSIEIGDSTYKVDYSELTQDQNDSTQKNVTITNTRLIVLNIKKVDSKNQDKALKGAEFKLQKKNGNTFETFGTNIATDNDGAAKIENLDSGIYKLTEVKAPTGYDVLGSSICFKVESGGIALSDENGNTINNTQSMWSLTSDNSLVLTIKNTEIYSLPSAGGPGIYGFTISGVAFITAALLLFINNKRKEGKIAG